MNELASLGLGIATDVFITDSIVKKISSFSDKKSINNFIKNLKEWEIQFEKQNDGTIATDNDFFAHIKYNHVIDDITAFVLDPLFDADDETTFLNNLHTKMITGIESTKGYKLSFEDRKVIFTFLNEILNISKVFLQSKVPTEDRALLYVAVQINAQIKELKKDIQNGITIDEIENAIQNNPQIAEIKKAIIQNQQFAAEKIEILQHQILKAMKEAETADSMKVKLSDWNIRQIKNLGNRYLPEINIPIDLTNTLNGLSLNQSFISSFLNEADEFLIGMRKLRFGELESLSEQLADYISNLEFFDFHSDHVTSIKAILSEMDVLLKDKLKSSLTDSTRYELYRALNTIASYEDYLCSSEVQAASSPFVLLTGDGGTGKSHLIADHIQQQASNGNINMLLLGQQFNGEDPLAILPTLLGTQITYQVAFQSFENIACKQNSRFIIFIDALNEGAGVQFWNRTLSGLLEFIKTFPHVGLLVSVRTQYEHQLFDEQHELCEQLIRIEHTGFSEVMFEAIQRFFSFYEITTDALSILNNEFSNPLFLRLFCSAHAGTKISINDLSLPNVYNKYIEHIEKCVADRCDYNRSIKLVSKIINRLVAERMRQSKNAVRLPLDEVLMLVTECCKQWNISKDVYSALLSEGVLTQGINFRNEEYVHITYERLEDYFVATKIVQAYDTLSRDEFVEQYDWILRKQDLLQFVGIVFAEEKAIELNSIFPNTNGIIAENLREAFLYGLLWRKTESITEKSTEYINSEILQYEYSFKQFVDILFALSTRSNHFLNSINTYQFFDTPAMPDRDSEFIPIFDELYLKPQSALHRLLNWGLYYSRLQPINHETAELAGTILSWLLISPNNEIRDKATKALVSVLCGHIDALISVIKRFESVDDQYVAERIYAVAFGCAVNSEDIAKLRELALYVFKTVFDKEEVYPNILLRTYAKNIIDYAVYLGCLSSNDYLAEKTIPPYKSVFPETPTDEEIKAYSLDTSSPDFQRHHYAQRSILSSMKVEYSRDGQPGGYGDFGRYIFQSYFHAWPNLHPMDLKNIAIKRIFELGYDVEKHGKYDCSTRRSLHQGKCERIGKKYQWIAFYELAAKVSDNFPMLVQIDNYAEKTKEFYGGSYYPDIRNIDPTVLFTPPAAVFSAQHDKYHLPNTPYEEWLENFDDAPSFESCVRIKYKRKSYILLSGEYSWMDSKKLGYEPYDLPRKNLWHQIRGYIVKCDSVEKLLESLHGRDFMGRWMPECCEDSVLFNKEFYWSDAYHFFKHPYYGNSEWISFDENWHNVCYSEKVLIPIRHYYSERDGDTNLSSDELRLSWYTICGDIFEALNLQYKGDKNSCLYDSNDNLVCFDSAELLGEHIGYFIDEEQLQNYLRHKGYCLIWTSLSEKQVINTEWRRNNVLIPQKTIHHSAVYQFKNGEIQKIYGRQVINRLYGNQFTV